MYYVFWILVVAVVLTIVGAGANRINDSLAKNYVEVAELRKAVVDLNYQLAKPFEPIALRLDANTLEVAVYVKKELENISGQLEEAIRWIKLK